MFAVAKPILQYLRELDWKTPVRRVTHRDFWRFYLVVVLCTALTYPAWQVLFPHTLWFYKLWGAGATGGGMVGGLVGFLWQLSDASRRSRSSGRFLAWNVIGGFGIVIPAALFIMGPMLHSEETELMKIRTLSAAEVSALSVRVPGQAEVKIVDRASIIAFIDDCRQSILFYPSHESLQNECQLTVDFVDGTGWTYEAGIPEKHRGEMALRFRAYVGYSYVLLPHAEMILRGGVSVHRESIPHD